MVEAVSNTPFDQRRMIVHKPTGCSFIRNGKRIPKPQINESTIDHDALATLLYTGTIFPPKTIFADFASIGMGGALTLDSTTGFRYEAVDDLFAQIDACVVEPFDAISDLAHSLEECDVDFDNATLLLSEGKDSMAIAFALAEMGVRIDCLMFSNPDSNVNFVESITRKLGHNLSIFRYENLMISEETLSRLAQAFEPTLDVKLLAYLVFPIERLVGRTLIEGTGNDIYMGHVPRPKQWFATHVCDVTGRLVPSHFKTKYKWRLFKDSPMAGVPFRNFTECQGLYSGFSQSLVEESVGGGVQVMSGVNSKWRELGFERARALSHGRFLDTYSFEGSTTSFAEMIEGRVFFPWAEESIAKKYVALNDKVRFRWPKVNKLLLRDALNKRESYNQAKVPFRPPISQILECNRGLVDKAVANSKTLGGGLKKDLASLKESSRRLRCGFQYALWEMACSEYASAP